MMNMLDSNLLQLCLGPAIEHDLAAACRLYRVSKQFRAAVLQASHRSIAAWLQTPPLTWPALPLVPPQSGGGVAP